MLLVHASQEEKLAALPMTLRRLQVGERDQTVLKRPLHHLSFAPGGATARRILHARPVDVGVDGGRRDAHCLSRHTLRPRGEPNAQCRDLLDRQFRTRGVGVPGKRTSEVRRRVGVACSSSADCFDQMLFNLGLGHVGERSDVYTSDGQRIIDELGVHHDAFACVDQPLQTVKRGAAWHKLEVEHDDVGVGAGAGAQGDVDGRPIRYDIEPWGSAAEQASQAPSGDGVVVDDGDRGSSVQVDSIHVWSSVLTTMWDTLG